MPLTPGARLGPYEIVAPIGEGGMGQVWRARDTRLDRTVAIKTSKSQFSERFEREARAVAALNMRPFRNLRPARAGERIEMADFENRWN